MPRFGRRWSEKDRDDLAEALSVGHWNIIREADDWRPLADHVLGLIRMYLVGERLECARLAEQPDGARKIRARGEDVNALAVIPAFGDFACPFEACDYEVHKHEVEEALGYHLPESFDWECAGCGRTYQVNVFIEPLFHPIAPE